MHPFYFKITSDDAKDLSIKSGKSLKLRGNENVFIDSKNLELTSKNNITLAVGKEVSQRRITE